MHKHWEYVQKSMHVTLCLHFLPHLPKFELPTLTR